MWQVISYNFITNGYKCYAVPERNPGAGSIQHTNITTFVQWISVILSVHFEVMNRSQKFPIIGLSQLKGFRIFGFCWWSYRK